MPPKKRASTTTKTKTVSKGRSKTKSNSRGSGKCKTMCSSKEAGKGKYGVMSLMRTSTCQAKINELNEEIARLQQWKDDILNNRRPPTQERISKLSLEERINKEIYNRFIRNMYDETRRSEFLSTSPAQLLNLIKMDKLYKRWMEVPQIQEFYFDNYEKNNFYWDNIRRFFKTKLFSEKKSAKEFLEYMNEWDMGVQQPGKKFLPPKL